MTTELNNDAAIVEPWMTELLLWADEFGYCRDVLPRNRQDLKSKIERYYNNKELLNIPKNIVNFPSGLDNLKDIVILQVTLQDDNLIPESLFELDCDIALSITSKQKKLSKSLLAQLAAIKSFTGLTIINDCLTELPDNLDKFKSLQKLVIPPQVFNQLSSVFIDKYRNDEICLRGHPISTLYTPLADDYSLCQFGFFLIDDDWNEQSLLDLKYKSAADFLFALQTSDKHIEKLDVIDGIIICEPEEVQQVMAVSATVLRGRYSRLPIDYGDVKRTLQFTKSAHFIQASALGGNKLERAEIAVVQLLGQIPKNTIVKSIVINIKSDCILWLDEIDIINTAIYTAFTDEADIWFSNEKIDKPKCCWIEAIYMVE